MPEIGTRRLKLFVGGVDMSAAVSNARIEAADSEADFVSFAAAAAGGAKDWFLMGTCVQNTDTTSLWDYMWSQAGSDVAFELWPNGQNTVSPTTATTTFPKFTGTATVKVPDGVILGGDADASSTARMTVDFEWQCLAKPTKVTT